MRLRFPTALLLLPAFAAGLAVGRLAVPDPPPGPDLTAEAGVMRLDDPAGTSRRLAPYRVVVDGTAANVSGARPEGVRWRLDLADGRVIVFAAEGRGAGP